MTKEREKEISDDEAEDDEKEEKKDDGDEDKEKVSLATFCTVVTYCTVESEVTYLF